jgi:hypothetical protein
VLVNGSVSFASDLPESESIATKLFWQGLVEMAFLAPTLSRSARFAAAGGIIVAEKRQSRFYA